MTIRVSRAGAQAENGRWVSQGEAHLSIGREGVAISFGTGGLLRGTDWTVYIGTSSYEELASLMVELAPKQAIKAFGKALAKAKLD